jgi:spore coat polysaccharide biosynthesis predicted glycosyltransferase SpsG
VARVIFITAASHRHGQGHYQRTLRMATAITNIRDVLIFCNQPISSKGTGYYSEKVVPFDFNYPELMFHDIKLNEDDLLWFDLPDEYYYFLSHFRDYSQKIVSINMFDKRNDLVFEDVSIYPCFKKTHYQREDRQNTIFMTGSDFIMVADEFFEETECQKIPGSVLISMGGADPMDLTKRLIPLLNQLERNDLVFQIVLPKTLKKEDVFCSFEIKPSVKLFDFGSLDFAKAIKQSEYAIISGGITRYECIAAKTFFIAISIHHAQYELTALTTKYGFGINFGVSNELKLRDLMQYIETLSLNPELPDPATQAVYLKKGAALRTFKTVIEAINKNESKISNYN